MPGLNADTLTLHVDGEEVPINVRVNKRARRIIIRFDAKTHDLIAVVPHKKQVRDILPFAEHHKEWIQTQQISLKNRREFIDGTEIPIRDLPHLIRHRPEERRGVWVEEKVDGGLCLCVSGRSEHSARRINDWLKKQARSDLSIACARYADKFELGYAKITVRDTYSRWGSCSHRDTLSFSWRLILAPSFVLDYVAAHETAHRIHLNHSKKFWDLTHSLTPNVDRAEKWLKQYGQTLFRYG